MAAIVALLALAIGGGNGERNFNAVTGGESFAPQTLIEHDEDLRPAATFQVAAQIEATPTASPVAIAPTVAAVQQSTVTVPLPAGLENCPAVIVETFGEQAPAACAVAWCESRYDPHAVGDGGDSLGMFQIQPRWHQWRVPGEDLMDAEVNTRAAWLISSGGTDWSAWTCQP